MNTGNGRGGLGCSQRTHALPQQSHKQGVANKAFLLSQLIHCHSFSCHTIEVNYS